MSPHRKKAISLLLVATMLFSGCTGESDNTQVNESETAIEEDQIVVDDVIEEEPQEEIEQKLVGVPDIIGCDNTNPIHCMLPFPSHAFLREDDSTETGFRMNYSTNTIPGSGITPVVSIPIINTRHKSAFRAPLPNLLPPPLPLLLHKHNSGIRNHSRGKHTHNQH